MKIKKYLSITGTVALLSLLYGCNGSSGENEEIIPPDPEAPILIASQILDQNCEPLAAPSQIAGSTFCIQATLTKNSQPVTNTTVTFDAPLGSLSPESKLSNSSGIAQVLLTSESTDIGAANLTISSGDASNVVGYEFLKDTTPTPTLPSITLAMLQDGQANNRFKQGETVEIQARLITSSGEALANERLDFSAELGQLNATGSLTDSQGQTSLTLTAADDNTIGAATLTASYQLDNDTRISKQFNYQILDADSVVEEQLSAGHFDQQGNFIANQIGLSLSLDDSGQVNLAAGGTLGVAISIVDENENPISQPTPISFTSNCVLTGQAVIDEQVLTINGTAEATYKDISCAGANGNQDQIIATIATPSNTITLTQNISLSGESLGSIEFLSAEPDSIVLKGTGGVNKQEISTLTFRVRGELGNLLPQQEVTFSANTTAGGLTITPTTALTNSQGEVATKVISGNVPTSVRVTATASANTQTIQTQSDLLSVNTGLADQNSISLAATILNPESDNINGVTSEITAWLADSFNNPVPDGTTVNFTTEGGQIEPSCQTTNGTCSVTWQSANPRVFNHRITILATALGHETFFDTNGNNTFDENDGNALQFDSVSSGFGRAEYQSSGFIDLTEAWRDDNEDNLYQVGEPFIDYNDDQVFAIADNAFNGPQCSGANCASQSAIHVRKALRLIMANGASFWALYDNTQQNPIAYNHPGETESGIVNSIARNSAAAYSLYLTDTALQTLPLGTTITITTDEGELVGQTSMVVGNNASGGSFPIAQSQIGNISFKQALANNLFGGQIMSFVLKNNLDISDSATTAVLEVTITSPSGVQGGAVISIPLE